jgi:DNA-binding transcriptional LysR family regulator
MRISLKQLSVFDAIAQTGSVSKAADKVNLSQSAASMSLAELESHLGAPLFHRHGKRLSLNDYGRWLQPKAHQLLIQAQEIEQSSEQEALQGSLKIGASSTIGNYLVPTHIAAFVKENPKVNIALEIANTEQIVAGMQSMSFDIGLIEGPSHAPQLNTTVWKKDELCIFCSAEHPLAQKKQINEKDLNEAEWILRELGSGTREIFSLATKDALLNPSVILELGNSEAVKLAVKTGLGLGCLSTLAIADDLEAETLVKLNCDFIDLQRDFFLIQRKDSYQSQLLKVFMESI